MQLDSRQYRAELKQGLTQFLMMMYESYRKEIGQEEAKKAVLECIEEMYALFSLESVTIKQVIEVIQDKMNFYIQKMNAATDFDTQMYYGEKVSVLDSAVEILKGD